MAGVDIGVVVYLFNAPQFQNMGTSSNRLCMFLSMGVPVIASRQPSFEFLEKYDCGVLVENEREFIDAIDTIQNRLPEMKENALRCAKEYIDAPGKYKKLVEALASL
jgi:glycosyltransferase involved in cell wall biosynthesis